MRAKILKMAGCKTEAEFYKKYPTEAAFKKKFGSEFEQLLKDYKNVRGPKKAQAGVGLNTGDSNSNSIPDYLESQNQGPTQGPAPANQFSFPQNFPTSTGAQPNTSFGATGKSYFNNMENTINTGNQWKQNNPLPSQIDQGQQIQHQMQQEQERLAQEAKSKQESTPSGMGKGMGYARRIVNAFKAKKAQKKMRKSAEQWSKVSDVALEASRSQDVNQLQDISDQQRRLRDAMMPEITGEELYPVYGVGTNVLTRNGGTMPMFYHGGEIQNTYDPKDLYSDLGYVPINNPNQMKAYADGGYLPKAQASGAMGGGGNWMSMVSNMMGGSGSGGAAAGNTGGTSGWKGFLGNMMGGNSNMFGGSGGAGASSGGAGTQGIGGGMLGGMMGGGGGGASAGGMGGFMKGMAGQSGGSPYGAAVSAVLGPVSEQGSAALAKKYNNNAGSQFGGIAGDMVGDIPVYGALLKTFLKPAFTWLGGKLDRDHLRTSRYQKNMMGNIGNMSWTAAAQNRLGGLQSSGVARHGSNMNPQVIKKFGNTDMSDWGKWFYSDMDTLRTGGNLRSNEVGRIQALSGGHLEPMSYNPYGAGTGVTSMIKGQSHDESNGKHSGVIMRYAEDGYEMGAPMVEAERGEPITEMEDIDGTSAIISGDQTFDANFIPELKEYNGKKMKNIHKELAEKDRKLNKQQTKNTRALNEFTPRTPFDKLTLNSLSMNEIGINSQYEDNAEKVSKLNSLQQAMNDAARERGWDSGELSRGRIKPADPRAAKNGMTMAQNSGKVEEKKAPSFQKKGVQKGALPSSDIGFHADDPEWGSQSGYYGKWQPKVYGAFADPTRVTKMLEYLEQYKGEGSDALKEQMGKRKNPQELVKFLQDQSTNAKIGPIHYAVRDAIKASEPVAPTAPAAKTTPAADEEENYQVVPKRDTNWATIAGQVANLFRKTPEDPLSGEQLAGEMFALSNQHPEAVQARFKQSLLDVPYDISYQDRLNENQASFRGIQRQLGNNPEALAALAAQKYSADSNVLAEQFRANQAMKHDVYAGNRATLNADQEKNLAIADQQYVRQAQARSNTKRDIFDALSSVSDKYLQNRLENRTLQTYANMFKDFSFDKNYNINKTGAPHEFNIDQIYTTQTGKKVTGRPKLDDQGRTIGIELVEIDDDGNEIVKAEKTTTGKTTTIAPPPLATPKTVGRNGSIVSAFKNL